jgi:hypothetical protein
MVVRVIEQGDEIGFFVDRSVFDQLHIAPDTLLEASTDGQALIIAPTQDESRRAVFEAALIEFDIEYGDVFKRLAE